MGGYVNSRTFKERALNNSEMTIRQRIPLNPSSEYCSEKPLFVATGSTFDMEEGEAVVLTSSKPNGQSLCDQCKTNPSKYKCPGCSSRSCGLPCVRAHKLRNGCTGKRNQTQFVPISQFDDNLLISDYNLLEEVKRVTESAQRLRNRLCLYNHFRLPFHLQSLRRAASSNNRRTKVLFLPNGMTRREKNQSRYDHRQKIIFWTIEFRFHATDVVLVDHGLNESRSLSSILEGHLKPSPWKNQLQKFYEEKLDNLKFFIRKYPKGRNSPFCELDINCPIRDQFSNLVILEYPIIYIFLPSQNPQFEVGRHPKPPIHKPELKSTPNDYHQSAEGVLFKEEKIEENHGSLASQPQIFDQERSWKALTNSSESMAKGAERNGISSSLSALESDIFDDMEFNFDQDLIDEYSNIMAEMNPDDFLDFQFGIDQEEKRGATELTGNSGGYLLDEELEEGEIV